MKKTEERLVNVLEDALTSYVDSNADVVHLELRGEVSLTAVYLSTLIEQKQIDERIVDKFYLYENERFDYYLDSISSPIASADLLTEKISDGYIIICYKERFVAAEIGKALRGRSVDRPESEAALIGPAEGFVENIFTNLNLIRQHYPKKSLCAEKIDFKKDNINTVYVLYDNEKVPPKLLKTFMERFPNAEIGFEHSTTRIAHALYQQKVVLFPRELSTERPDRICRYLSTGKIVILINGDPFAIALPVTFHEFLTAQDDYRIYPIPRIFLMFLRYCSFFLSMTLPGIYVASTAYNPELFRVQLALSVASSRQGIPFPSFLEVAFMLLLMELLVEGSLRLPRTVGPAATTVGGLILGQAATQAHLVSDIMIIVVASVAITNFVIPVTIMTISSRLLKYFLLVLSSLGGMYGVFIGVMLIIAYLFSIQNMEVSYIQPPKFLEKSWKDMLKRGKKNA